MKSDRTVMFGVDSEEGSPVVTRSTSEITTAGQKISEPLK
jgi:hypothetical protein